MIFKWLQSSFPPLEAAPASKQCMAEWAGWQAGWHTASCLLTQ